MKRYVKVEVVPNILEYLSFRVSLDAKEGSVESTVKDSGHVLQLQFYAILSPMPFLPFPFILSLSFSLSLRPEIPKSCSRCLFI